MDKQIKYLFGVLLLIIISAYFLSLFTGLPQFFKDDIIAFLEERISGEISFSSVSLWPLNRIRLNDFEYRSDSGTAFKGERLNLDYSLNFRGEEEIFKIEFVELVEGEIELGQDLLNRITELSDSAAAQSELEQDLLSQLTLPEYITDLDFNIVDSKINFKTEKINFELNNLQLGLQAEAEDNYTLNLSTALIIDNLELEDSLSLSGLDLNNLDLQFIRAEEQAEIYFKSDYLALKPLLNNLEKRNYSYQGFDFNLAAFSGLAAVKGEVKVKDSEVTEYNSEFDFKDLNFAAVYNYAETEQDFNFSLPALNLTAAGPDLELAAAESRIFINQSLVNLAFKFNHDYSYQLQAESQNFNLDYDFFKPYLEQGEFDFSFNLEGKADKILNAAAVVETNELNNSIADLESSQMKFQLQGEKIFLDQAEFILSDGGELDLRGNYNLNQENYLLRAEARNLKISDSLIRLSENFDFAQEADYSQYLDKIKNERLNFLIDTAGIFGKNNDFSAVGDIELDFNLVEAVNKFELAGSFWYTQDKLMLNSLSLDSDFGYLDLMGEIDLASEKFNLRYAAKNLDFKILNYFYEFNAAELEEINPTVEYAEGSITDSFTAPTVNLRLKMQELNYQDYALQNITLKTVYQNNNLAVKELKVELDQALFKVSGEINNLSAALKAELDLILKSENLYFQDLSQFTGGEMPLRGALQLEAGVTGTIEDYNLDFQLSSLNSIAEFDGQEFELSNLNAIIKKENDNFLLEELTAEQQNLRFRADGLYNLESGFDLNYQLSGFELNQYLTDYITADQELQGSLKLSGDLKGGLENAVLNFKAAGEDISFAGLDLELGDNSFQYDLAADRILIDSFDFKIDSGRYRLGGEIYDLNTDVKTELSLELLEVPTRDLSEKFAGLYPLTQDMILSGKAAISSAGSNYSAQLELRGDFAEIPNSEFNLSGNIGQELDINFEASNLMVDLNSTQYNFNLNLKSKLNFSGSLGGSLEAPVLKFSHNFIEPSINNTGLESLKGEIMLENRRRFSASETIAFKEGGNLTADASYSFTEDEISLSSNLNSLPLAFILSFFGENITADGEVNGNFRAEGSLESPVVAGQLVVAAEELELGLSDPIRNFSADIKLEQAKAVIESAEGEFVDGNFSLAGELDLFSPDNFWNLTLNGERLNFEHGSLAGFFDADFNFKGPLLSPLLTGDLEVYDFIIGIPFKWPAAETEAAVLVPEIDLDIVPGENVRVVMENPQMEITVESGSLNVSFEPGSEDSLSMEGRLRSSEGIFSYYNSRFRLDNAEAVFTPVDENDIPTLRANATTYAGGREINISINGPADNMRISLSSVPEMSEEEILNLLSSRGALGSAIIGGEDVGIQNIILQELIRILNSFLQEDVISGLESDFKSVFSLDRIELDTYQYGVDREITLYLGKNITDRLYLEYASFFSNGEQEGEISFQYKLTDLTVLKGSYFGDDEYQISIETEIEF